MSVLLRQPHGFEGFGPVRRMVVDVDDLAVAQLDVRVRSERRPRLR